MITFKEVAKRGRGWLPLIGVNALIGSAVTLALPTVLGRSVDSIVAGAGYTRWLVVAASLIGLGIAASIIDAFAGAACVAETTAWLRHRLVRHVVRGGPGGTRDFETGDLVTRVSANATDAAQAGPAAVTAIAAVAPPLGSLVLLAVIDPWLAAAFFGGVLLVVLVLWTFAKRTADVSLAYQETQGRIAALLSEALTGIRTITAAGTTEREERRILGLLPELHRNGVVTWRILARSGAQAAVVGPLVLVAVLAVGGLQLVSGRITAGELFAASQYAVLGAGLGNLTGVLGEIARATHAHDFVSRLPDGYLTSLRKAPMSGGERQRLGLARAWPARRLLVLDDATSSLDTATERQISRTLTEDRHRRTRLIVTHRPATAARADLVIWLDHGQVRAIAPHAELWHNTSYRAVFG